MSQTRLLVDVIEKHSDELTERLVRRLREHRQTRAYGRLDPLLLASRARAIYERLGYWLRSSSDLELEDAFHALGLERCREGIPLSDVVAAELLTRQTLWEFVDERAGDTIVQLRGELDLQGIVTGFFDRAVYHTVRGYEAGTKERMQSADSPRP